MQIEQAIEQFKSGKLDQIEIRRNPSDRRQWFVMVFSTNGKYLMLADENDHPVVDEDLERLFILLKKIGLGEARIFF